MACNYLLYGRMDGYVLQSSTMVHYTTELPKYDNASKLVTKTPRL